MPTSITAQDAHELQLAPIWVLAAIGGADGKITKAERATLVEAVHGCAAHFDPFVAGVFQGLEQNFDSAWESYMRDERFAVHALKTVVEVLERVTDPPQALHFKQTLVRLGVDVADTSGGILGVGNKRNSLERAALVKLADALNLESDRLAVAARPSFESILVALDGTPQGERAIPVARALAGPLGAKVTLVRVTPAHAPSAVVAIDGTTVPVDLPTTEELQAQAAAYLESVRSSSGEPGWATAVVEGEAAESIVKAARQCGANLIVIATSGSPGLRRVFETKVTEDVVRLSDIPVLVVPVEALQF